MLHSSASILGSEDWGDVPFGLGDAPGVWGLPKVPLASIVIEVDMGMVDVVSRKVE